MNRSKEPYTLKFWLIPKEPGEEPFLTVSFTSPVVPVVSKGFNPPPDWKATNDKAISSALLICNLVCNPHQQAAIQQLAHSMGDDWVDNLVDLVRQELKGLGLGSEHVLPFTAHLSQGHLPKDPLKRRPEFNPFGGDGFQNVDINKAFLDSCSERPTGVYEEQVV